MRVEYSFDGYVRTGSLRMSPSSSDNGSSFTIKSSRLIGAITFLAFFQSGLTHVDLSLFLRARTLKIYLLISLKTSVAVWVHNCMRICVGCTNFVHVCVKFCKM